MGAASARVMTTIRRHEPALDGIRGIAILLVLFTHCNWVFRQTKVTKWFLPAMTFGWCGVDLFFVLSGYLITGILLRTKMATNRTASFYARRFLRIFPIYYLCLSAVLLAAPHWAWMKSLLPYYRIGDRIAYFAYLQNWLSFRHSLQTPPNILGHFWSLAVEEQFYLVWPILVWKVPEKYLLRLCVWGIVAGLALSSALVLYFGPHLWIDVLTPTRGLGLLVGSALAIYLARDGHISGRALLGMAAAGASIIAFIALEDRREFMDTDAGPYMYTIAIPALALIFGALVGSSRRFIPVLTPALNNSWLKSFGKYSYGIYVYHIPFFVLVSRSLSAKFGVSFPLETRYGLLYVAVVIGIIFGLAWLSYNLFESKFLELKRHFDPIFETSESTTVAVRGASAGGAH